jgi:hypothetical protein
MLIINPNNHLFGKNLLKKGWLVEKKISSGDEDFLSKLDVKRIRILIDEKELELVDKKFKFGEIISWYRPIVIDEDELQKYGFMENTDGSFSIGDFTVKPTLFIQPGAIDETRIWIDNNENGIFFMHQLQDAYKEFTKSDLPIDIKIQE